MGERHKREGERAVDPVGAPAVGFVGLGVRDHALLSFFMIDNAPKECAFDNTHYVLPLGIA